MRSLNKVSYIDSGGNEIALDSVNSSFDIGANQTILKIKQTNGQIAELKTRNQDCIIATFKTTSSYTLASVALMGPVQAIDWGDGTFDMGDDGSVTLYHRYAQAGEWKVLIYYGGTAIDDYAFSGSQNLIDIVLPNNITLIGSWAFNNCTSLKKIDIPDSVTTIMSRAFNSCTALTDVSIGNNVTQIGSSAFYNCSSLKNVRFKRGSQLTTIYNQAFRNCSNLKSFVIPSGTTTIQYQAFYGCTNLINVVIPASVTSMGGNVFNGPPAASLVIYYEGSSIPSGWASTFNNGSSNYYPIYFNVSDAMAFVTIAAKDINSESLRIIDTDTTAREVSKLNNVNGQILFGDDVTLFDCDAAGRLGLIGRRKDTTVASASGIRYYKGTLDSSNSKTDSYADFYYSGLFWATKPIKANHFYGTANMALYASSSDKINNKTIEQRLTDLGF